MYDDILFPTDGSAGADAALEHALELADTYDSRVHALFVVDTTYAGRGAASRTTTDELRERGRTIVADVTDRAGSVSVVEAVEEGDPYRSILSYASEHDVDLIVMGTRGRSGVDRYLLGSVTEKVVRTADAPVFTVRAGAED